MCSARACCGIGVVRLQQKERYACPDDACAVTHGCSDADSGGGRDPECSAYPAADAEADSLTCAGDPHAPCNPGSQTDGYA